MSAEKIYEQLKGQTQNLGTEKYFQTGAAGTKEGGLGSVDAVLRDMAQRLADAGLSSIEQFGVGTVPTYANVVAIPQTTQGKPLGWDPAREEFAYEQIPTGKWFYQEVIDDYNYTTVWREIPQSEIERLGLNSPASLANPTQRRVDVQSGTKQAYINKATGQELAGFRAPETGTWAMNTAGDGQTLYGVSFDPATGLPIFGNQQTHGRQQYTDLLKVAGIAAAIFAPQIGAALAPSLSGAAQLAIGSAISGLVGSGGNLEAGIKAGLASYLGGQAGSWASKAANSALVGNIAANMTRTAILGGKMEDALVSTLVQAAPAEIAKYVPNFKDLPRAAQEAAVAATVDLMRTGGDNLGQIAMQGAASGATDYALGQIEGYNNLRAGQKDVIRQQVSQALTGKDLGKAALDAAIGLGNEAVRYTVDTERAQNEGWQNLEQKQGAQQLYGPKVTPAEFENRQTTTEQEAKDFAQQMLGRPATEFELLELIGLSETDAKNALENIRYDEATFDSNELIQTYKDIYGVEPPEGWLGSEEALDMLGRSEAQGKNMLQNYYIQDKNTTTGTEAQKIWESMGNTGPIPEDVLFNMLATSETASKAMAETYKIVSEDQAATTFDGSGYETTAQAREAAKKAGYNAFIDPETGRTAIIAPEAETNRRSELMREMLNAQGINPLLATPEQIRKTQELVMAIPQDKLKDAQAPDILAEAGIAGGSYVKIAPNVVIRPVAPGPSAPPAFNGTTYTSQTNAAIAAANAGKSTFTWTDGKTYQVPKAMLEDGKSGKLDDKTLTANLLSLQSAFERGELNTEQYKFLETQVRKQQNAVNNLVYNKDMKSAAEAAGQSLGSFKLLGERSESKNTLNALELATDYALSTVDGIGGALTFFGQTIDAITTNPQGEGDMYTGFVSGTPTKFFDKNGNWLETSGNAVQEFAQSRYSDTAKEQRAAILKEINRPGATEASVGAAILRNPHGYSTFTIAELTEEVVPFLAGGALGTAFKLGTAGVSALAATAATTADLAEVYGPTYNKIYNEAKKAGKDDATAYAMATQAASGNALITALTEGPANFLLAKGLLSSAAGNAGLRVGGQVGLQMGQEYIESLAHNINEQYITTGEVPKLEDINRYRGQAAFEALVAAGTTGGMYTLAAANPNQFIAKDKQGKDITFAEAVTAPERVDFSTVKTDASFVDPETGKATSFLNVLGSATTTYSNGYDFNITESVVSKNPMQALEVMTNMGLASWQSNGTIAFSPDAGNIATAFIASGNAVPDASGNFVVPQKSITRDEAEQYFKEAGYTPTEAEINQFVRQGADVTEASVRKEIGDYMASRQELETRLSGAISDAIAKGLEGDAALQAGLDSLSEKMGTNQADLLAQLGITAADLKKQFSEEIGVVSEKIGSKTTKPTEADVSAALRSYLGKDPFNAKYDWDGDGKIDLSDTLNLLKASQGKPTSVPAAEDSFWNQPTGVFKDIADTRKALEDAIQAAKDIGLEGDAAIQAGLDSLAEKMGTNQADLLAQLGTTAADLKAQFAADIQASREATAQEIADTKTALEEAIADAKAAGLKGDEALQAAIDAVAADQKTNATGLLEKLGTTAADLKTEFAEGLAGVSTEISDTRKALEDAIQAAKDIGLEGDAALQAAIDSVAAELGTTKTDLLTQLGTTEEALRTEFATGLAGVSAEVKAAYDALTAEQKALADALTQQGVDLNTAIEAAVTQTQEKIGELSADLQAKYDTLTAEQKALADQLRQQGLDTADAIEQARTAISADVQAKYNALNAGQKALADQLAQQGVDLRTAIDVAAQQTQQQVLDLGTQLNTRVDQLMKQGMDQYAATQQAIAEVNQQNQQLQDLVGTQGRTATQQDIDTLNQMLSGQREVDLTYDVTGDRQITQADIDFLARVVGGQEWTAPAGSVWAPTGLYGQIAAAEAQRQADLAEQARQAQEAEKRAATRTLASQAQTQLQNVMGQLPAAYQALQTTTTPIYAGEMTPFDLGSPLDVDFFSPSKEKQGSQTGQQPTKIATGGYLDDLLDLLR